MTYYPFSGPDFLYADAFFPDASTYILAGLEPTGQIPDVLKLRSRSVAHRTGEAHEPRSAPCSKTSYFITSEMGADLQCQPAARHAAAAVRVPGAHREDDPRRELRRSRAGWKPADRPRDDKDAARAASRSSSRAATPGRGRSTISGPTSATRRAEQRLPAILRAVRHRRCLHQGGILPASQRGASRLSAISCSARRARSSRTIRASC